MSGHRIITSAAVYERTSGLPVDASAVMWIKNHGTASGENKWSELLQRRELHDRGSCDRMHVRAHVSRATGAKELLTVAEVVVVAFDRDPRWGQAVWAGAARRL